MVDWGVSVDPVGAGPGPLHIAASREWLDMMDFLVGKGSDIDALPGGLDGSTPLARVLEAQEFEYAEFLLAVGSDLDLASGMDGDIWTLFVRVCRIIESGECTDEALSLAGLIWRTTTASRDR
jgi:ankyrin repeat protein